MQTVLVCGNYFIILMNNRKAAIPAAGNIAAFLVIKETIVSFCYEEGVLDQMYVKNSIRCAPK